MAELEELAVELDVLVNAKVLCIGLDVGMYLDRECSDLALDGCAI